MKENINLKTPLSCQDKKKKKGLKGKEKNLCAFPFPLKDIAQYA